MQNINLLLTNQIAALLNGYALNVYTVPVVQLGWLTPACQ